MKLKKINAFLSKACSITLLIHILITVITMLTGFKIYIVHKILAEAISIFASLHMVISLIIVLIIQKGPIVKCYQKENIRTLIQRDSGVLTLVFMFWHMNSLKFIGEGTALSNGNAILIIAAEVFFFAFSLLHLGVSFTKSLISSGSISNEIALKKADKITSVICIVFFCFSIVSVVIYVSKYMGWM